MLEAQSVTNSPEATGAFSLLAGPPRNVPLRRKSIHDAGINHEKGLEASSLLYDDGAMNAVVVSWDDDDDHHVERLPPLQMLEVPNPMPMTQEELIAEVKAIYAGLVMVETKCIKACLQQVKQYLAQPERNFEQLFEDRLTEDIDSLYFETTTEDTLLPSSFPSSGTNGHGFEVSGCLPEFTSLSSSYQQLLEAAGSLLNNAEDELLHYLQLTDDILQRLWKRLQKNKHQLLIYAFIFFHFFFEFPDGIRHHCTTMPWTIWPVLAVLWGVFWMFRPQCGADDFVGYQGDNLHLESPDSLSDSFFENLWSSLPDPPPRTAGPGDSCGSGIVATTQDALAFSTWSVDASFASPLWFSNEATWPVYEQPEQSTSDRTMAIGSSFPLISSSDMAVTATNASESAQLREILGVDHATTGSASPVETLSPLSSERVLGDERASSATMLAAGLGLTGTQSVDPTCSVCGNTFTRPDSLKRHMREMGHDRTAASNSRDTPEFCCPHSWCKRSEPGCGFKRPDKRDRHVISCRRRRQLKNGKQASAASPAAAFYERDATAAVQTARGISPDNSLGGEPTLKVLQSLYRDETEKLRVKEEERRAVEQECQRSRALLAHLERAIKTASMGNVRENTPTI